jgi:A/G-specific adenine glycosylase
MAWQPMSLPFKFSQPQIRAFRRQLLGWYKREKRTLPWRGERDPYRILVSEIMLQQTRVAVVENRYRLFMRRFPTERKLARAREQTVLAAWSGLGYYRRARALHAAAKQVTHAGGFPLTAEQLLELPGVGRYTAAAVASIAYGEQVAVVDGNVKRVVSRLTGRELKEEENWSMASTLLDPRRPGDFNQAMMELGALVCLPTRPKCERCPVRSLCAERGFQKARSRPARRKAVLRYNLALRNGQILLQQRSPSASLMAGMWELPECGASMKGTKPILRLRHSITMTDYAVLIYESYRSEEGSWISLRAARRMALTGLTRKILCTLENAKA